MSDKLVFVAAFYSPIEAQLACGLLETEGIKAFHTGDQAVNAFGIAGLGGQIRIEVAEANAERAAEILAPHFERPTDEGADSADDAALWLCPFCGDAVNDDLDFCPACDTQRPAARGSLAVTTNPGRGPISQEIQEGPTTKPDNITADEPLEAPPPALDSDIDVPDMETMVGDDLVRRAFIASLFGVLIPYSLWLLTRLAFYQGKISPKMMPRLYFTLLIDAFWLLAFLLPFAAISRFR